MKITKEQLKNIIKEELQTVQEGGAMGHMPLMPILEDALSQALPAIEQAYNSLPDDATKAEFEKALMKNMQLYVDKWKAERGETPSSHMTSDERLAHMHDFVSRQDDAPAGENPFRSPDPAMHRKMRLRARQGKHGIPPHE